MAAALRGHAGGCRIAARYLADLKGGDASVNAAAIRDVAGAPLREHVS